MLKLIDILKKDITKIYNHRWNIRRSPAPHTKESCQNKPLGSF